MTAGASFFVQTSKKSILPLASFYFCDACCFCLLKVCTLMPNSRPFIRVAFAACCAALLLARLALARGDLHEGPEATSLAGLGLA